MRTIAQSIGPTETPTRASLSWKSLERRACAFAFAPASPLPLGVLRILLSSVLLWQAIALAPDFFDLYGSGGILQGSLGTYFADDTLPGPASWIGWLGGLGIGERPSLLLLAGTYFLSLFCLWIGFFTRPAASVAWFTHLLLARSHFANYGVDQLAHVFLFYFIWMPVGASLSVDLALERASGKPSEAAGFSLRVLQFHLCLVYLASGIGKMLGDQWWTGEAIWRALMLPVYAQFDFAWMSRVPWLAKMMAWGTLFIEVGYPVFIWPRFSRLPWVIATVGLHLGIWIFLGLGTFAALMASLTLAAFGVTAVTSARALNRSGS